MTYSLTTWLSSDETVSILDNEIEVEIEFEHFPGFRAYYDAPEPDEFEIVAVSVDGKKAPDWIVDLAGRWFEAGCLDDAMVDATY